jgi:membrane protein
MVASEHIPAASPHRRKTAPQRGSLALGLAMLGAMTLRRRFDRGKEAEVGQVSSPRPKQSLDRGIAPGRGREAQSPSEIPAAGWKDVLWRVYERFQSDRVMLIAAGVTYYGLLALFPAIAALVSLYGLFADPDTIKQQLSNLQGVLPEDAIQIIGDQITHIQAQGGGRLGIYFAIGLIVSLWSANAGVKSMFDALNAVYGETERRSFVQYNFQALLFTLGGILFIILALGGIVVMPAIFAFVGLESVAGWIVSLLRWPVLLAFILLGLALLYRYGPSRETAEWRWVTWGSGFAAVVWLVVSMLFSWYVSSFGNFNETYGSLGAVIGFMIWMWLSATIVLVGAEINAELEHQTAEDTTTGEPQPMGQRGARYADHVASN